MAYDKIRKWQRNEVSFDLVYEDSSLPVVTIKILVPNGALYVMGEPREIGKTLVVAAAHISSTGIVPNDVGINNLRLVADVIMEGLDYDGLVVKGSVRATGANIGHRPRPFRFARNTGHQARTQLARGEKP